MFKNIIVKYKGLILLIIGSLLIILAIYLALYSRIDLIKERVFSETEYLINNNTLESNCNCDIENEVDSESFIDISTDYIEIENNDKDENENNTIKKNYIGYLEIPRISLKYGFVEKGSYYNHVDRNIQIIEPSDYPDVEKGNFIIAGHSGNASISYFKNLYLLKIGDTAKVTYKNRVYTYKIVDIYKDSRDGTIIIKRNLNKTILTLITCSYKDKKNQTVYIAELQSVK